jgi:hypothetical protein
MNALLAFGDHADLPTARYQRLTERVSVGRDAAAIACAMKINGREAQMHSSR